MPMQSPYNQKMIMKETKKKPAAKKNDPVSRYQSMQNEWSKSSYLAKSKTGGRKLELDRFNKWR